MATSKPKPRFALDANFPQPILKALAPYLVEADLVPIQDVDPALGELDDWELILAVHHRGFHALVSNDYNMLYGPRVLMAASKTRTSLVVIEALGDDPVRATGALLLDLPSIVSHMTLDKAHVYYSSRRAVRPERIQEYLEERAKRQGIAVRDLARREAIDTKTLQDPKYQARGTP